MTLKRLWRQLTRACLRCGKRPTRVPGPFFSHHLCRSCAKTDRFAAAYGIGDTRRRTFETESITVRETRSGKVRSFFTRRWIDGGYSD